MLEAKERYIRNNLQCKGMGNSYTTFISLCIVLSFIGLVNAAGIIKIDSVEGTYNRSVAVFTGEVVSYDNYTGYYVFDVITSYKGDLSGRVRLKYGCDTIPCQTQYYFEGQKYLVYAYGSLSALGTHYGFRTRLLSEAGDDIEELERIVNGGDDNDYVKGEIIVGFNDGVTAAQANALIDSYDLEWKTGSPTTTFGLLRVYVKVPVGDEQKWIDILENSSLVKYGSLNPISYTMPNCENLYWFDSTHSTCSQKQFCGMYMYYGLSTFETKVDCEVALDSMASQVGCRNYSIPPCPNGKLELEIDDNNCSRPVCIGNNSRFRYEDLCKNEKCTLRKGESVVFDSFIITLSDFNTETVTFKINGGGFDNELFVINSTQGAGFNILHCGSAIRLDSNIGNNADTLTFRLGRITCGGAVPLKQEFNLSNGRKVEIKVMPETASAKAIERLGELGWNVTLKEVGKGDGAKAVYSVEGEKNAKIFGLFKKKAKVSVEVDAETGEVVGEHKPWWSFLASGV